VRKYIAVAAIQFRAQMVYRFDVIITALSAVWRVLFAWILWGAIFAGRDEVGGFTFQAMLSYYVIDSFFSTLDISWNVAEEVSRRIREGTFSKYMVIPSDPQFHFLSQSFGTGGYYGLFAALAAMASSLAFGISHVFTSSLPNILAAVAIFLLGTVFMSSFNFFVGIWAFKFQDMGFLLYTFPAILRFFKGEFVPLSLLPDALEYSLRFIPFTHIAYTPTMLLINRMDLTEGLIAFAVLSAWTFGMLAVSRLTYRRMRTKYEGVGL